jgi:hypothetical protein
MCSQNDLELEYDHLSGRYNEELYKCLLHLKNEKTLSNDWKDSKYFTEAECDFNIVCTHKKQEELNAKWFSYHASLASKMQRDTIDVGGLKLFVGCPIICNVNMKSKKIFNSERFYVTNIDNDTVELQNTQTEEIHKLTFEEMTIKKKSKFENDRPKFMHGYAETVYRLQGITLRKNYNVYEIERMTFENIYVALSRATCKEKIGIKHIDKKFHDASPSIQYKAHITKKEPYMGYIYKLYDDNNSYIGCTNNVERREEEHYEKPVSDKMKEWLSTGKKKMEVLDSFKVLDDCEMLAIEKLYIQKLKPNMNTQHTNCSEEIKWDNNIHHVEVKGFNINEGKNYYYIRYTDKDGKRVVKKKNFDEGTRDWAYNYMLEEQAKLIKAYKLTM